MEYRLFRNTIPDINDTVLVQVTKKSELGFNVILLEYNNIPGFLPISRTKSNRRRKVNIKINEQFYADVYENNDDIIGVGKHRVDTNMIPTYTEHTAIANKMLIIANNIFIIYKHFYGNATFETIMEHSIWKLYDDFELNYLDNSLYTQVISNLSMLFDTSFYSNEFILFALNVFKNITKINPMIIETEFILKTTFIEAIQELSRTLDVQTTNTDNLKSYILCVSSPKYKIVTETIDQEQGFNELARILELIQNNINDTYSLINIIKENSVIRQIETHFDKLTEDGLQKLLKNN